ncbi:ImpA family type VI secretion-associated protein [Klebsiella pneumoniae]|uniref:ImpA family type VI secretion-associated protein n=1 Tax=Klebsiella pneumoniae TaxID=573 RepID=A0A4P0Y9Q7_KLEPN|nr:ImpA family type VI secretion-associated protein [Klebsiella pneumoniae]
MDTSSIITGTTLNRYQLDIPSCTASLDVEEFSGAEKLSELYYYTITFTSAEKNIDAAQLLSKPAMLTMGGSALQQLADCKRVHGVITTFRRVNRSEDQSTYQITLQPFLSLLDKQFRSHRFFVNKSVPEVVEQVLQEHHLHDWEYEFNLKQPIHGASKLISIRRATWRLSSACWQRWGYFISSPCRKRPRAKWSTSPTRSGR